MKKMTPNQFYCLSCKEKKTLKTQDIQVKNVGKSIALNGTCKKCHKTLNKFVSAKDASKFHKKKYFSYFTNIVGDNVFTVPVNQIKIDRRVQHCVKRNGGLFPSHLEINIVDPPFVVGNMLNSKIDKIMDGYDSGQLPPIDVNVIYSEGKRMYSVVNGRHRLCATIIKGDAFIPVRVVSPVFQKQNNRPKRKSETNINVYIPPFLRNRRKSV